MMKIETSAGVYDLTYIPESSKVKVESSTIDAMDLFIDGVELVTGEEHKRQKDTLAYIDKGSLALYFAFEIEEYLEYE